MKCALITGGSRGIGKAISITIANELDYHVLINYNGNEDAAKQTLNTIKENGGSAEIIKFNVGNHEEVNDVLNKWQENNPNAIIEVIVNNAGIAKDGLFMWMTKEDWDVVINTSLNGFYNVTQNLIQKLLRNKYGRIINIVSVSGVKGTAGQTNYSAAKGAIIAATKALSAEIAKRNITVNAVAPGFIKTDMTQDLDEKELVKMIPCNRFGEAQEIADLVTFLASKKSSYITGEIININGGIYS